MTEECQDCPVSEATCKARRETIAAEIKGLKTAIYASAGTVTLAVTLFTFALKFWHP